MTLQEEQSLIANAQKNPELFGKVFDHYYKHIFHYCLRRLPGVQPAEDVTSEVFFKALKSLKKFRWQGVPFTAWLFKIAANEVVSYYRKGLDRTVSLDQLQESQGFDVAHHEQADTDMVLQEQQGERLRAYRQVLSALNKLPELYREPLSLRFLEKLSVGDIAHVLEKPEGTVKSLLSRGTEMLKSEFEKTQPVKPARVVTGEAYN